MQANRSKALAHIRARELQLLDCYLHISKYHLAHRRPNTRFYGACITYANFFYVKLEKAGIIRRSNSPWASLLHLVPKKDGSWRPCGDYRRLNAVTVPDRYPLPNMQSLNDRMAGCTVFSKIDLVKAYHQIPIAE